MKLLLTACAVLWLTSVAVMLIVGIVRYLRIKGTLGDAAMLEKGAYASDAVRVPFILGLFPPRVYVPAGLEGKALDFVLAHERAHLRRGDPWMKLLSYLLLSVHWFNPLVWLAFWFMSRDMEMSCDERVLSGMEGNAENYSRTLLSFAAGRRFPAPAPLAFGESDIKSRIKNALRWRRPKLWVTILAVILCLAVIAVCIANPTGKLDPQKALDPEVLALAEESDAICIAYASKENPEKVFPYEYPRKRLLRCLVTEDFRGNLTEEGTELSYASNRYIYVLVDVDWRDEFLKDRYELLLFLDVADVTLKNNPVFIPHGEQGLRKPELDRKGRKLTELLRAWGKEHPGEPLWNEPSPDLPTDISPSPEPVEVMDGLSKMSSLTAEDITGIITDSWVRPEAEELIPLMNAAAAHYIAPPEDTSLLPFWQAEVFLAGGPDSWSSLDEHYDLCASLTEDLVRVRYCNGTPPNQAEEFWLEDAALYSLIRGCYRSDGVIDPDAWKEYGAYLKARAQETVDTYAPYGAGRFVGYDIIRLEKTEYRWHAENGESLPVYTWNVAFYPEDVSHVGWAGGMRLDADERVVGFEQYTYFAVREKSEEPELIFLGWDEFLGEG